MKNIKLQRYDADIEHSYVIGTLTLTEFLEGIKRPDDATILQLKKIASAAAIGDLDLKAKLKNKLSSVIVTVEVNHRRRKVNIKSFTGLMALDFDHLAVDEAIALKHLLFNRFRSIIAAWISPSKKGVKILMSIPKATNIKAFRAYYRGAADAMQHLKGFDDNGGNPVHPLFWGHDPDILIRERPSVWRIRAKITVNKLLEAMKVKPLNFKPSEAQAEWIVNWYSDSITGIDGSDDGGHPNVLRFSRVLGGYVGAGYLTRDEAFKLSDYLISTNDYLSKGTHGYQITARTFIDYGIPEPLYTPDDALRKDFKGGEQLEKH